MGGCQAQTWNDSHAEPHCVLGNDQVRHRSLLDVQDEMQPGRWNSIPVFYRAVCIWINSNLLQSA